MNRVLSFSLAVPLLILASGCSERDPQAKGIAYAADLTEAIDEYDSARKDFGSAIAEVSLDNEAVASGDSEVRLAALNRFKEQWGLAREECEDLQTRLDNFKGAAANYFANLDSRAKEIEDSQLRTRTSIANKKIAVEWSDALRAAENNMDLVWAAITKGNDISIVIELAILRAAIDETIGELQNLQAECAGLVSRLEDLTEEGKGLTINI